MLTSLTQLAAKKGSLPFFLPGLRLNVLTRYLPANASQQTAKNATGAELVELLDTVIVEQPSHRIFPTDRLDNLLHQKRTDLLWIDVRAGVESFVSATKAVITSWEARLEQAKAAGKKVVIWGASSKGVAFLTSLLNGDVVEYAVDINPFKQGRFLPGAGQEIVGPEQLEAYRPDLVIPMNPIYLEEIRSDLARRGLTPELLAV